MFAVEDDEQEERKEHKRSRAEPAPASSSSSAASSSASAAAALPRPATSFAAAASSASHVELEEVVCSACHERSDVQTTLRICLAPFPAVIPCAPPAVSRASHSHRDPCSACTSMDSARSAFRMESRLHRYRRWRGGYGFCRRDQTSSHPFAIKRT